MRLLHHGHKHPEPVTDSATFATPEASEETLGGLLVEVMPPQSMRPRYDKGSISEGA
jgi:hypothetical protein